MIIHKRLFVLIFLLPCFLFAQQVKPVADFSKVDTLAKTIKYDNDINLLTKQLTDPFPQQILKVRAIFRWMTENIAYDFKYYNKYYYKGKEPKSFSCSGDSMQCEIKKRVWETEYVSKVLQQKKAVCQGYSMLFKQMCDIVHIPSEIIPGYVRTEYYEVGTPGELIHAWNAVLLNGEYYLLDATWAAGGCTKDDDGKLLSFHKYFNDYYWLTPREEFAKDHFPEDPKWVLMPHYTQEKFSANPYYAPDEVSNIKLIAPGSGIITAKKAIPFILNWPMQETFATCK
jgi:transglutaminase/protease-like cytokinesis protein 3